jgi:hypothetical protein
MSLIIDVSECQTEIIEPLPLHTEDLYIYILEFLKGHVVVTHYHVDVTSQRRYPQSTHYAPTTEEISLVLYAINLRRKICTETRLLEKCLACGENNARPK